MNLHPGEKPINNHAKVNFNQLQGYFPLQNQLFFMYRYAREHFSSYGMSLINMCI